MPDYFPQYDQYQEFLRTHAEFLNTHVKVWPKRNFYAKSGVGWVRTRVKLPAGEISRDQLYALFSEEVKKIPEGKRPYYEPWRNFVLLYNKQPVRTGQILSEFKEANNIPDDVIRDYVASTEHLTVHSVTTMDDVYQMFRPNVGCIAVGGSHVQYNCGWDLEREMKRIGLFPQGWVLGFPHLTPHYVKRGNIPVARFLLSKDNIATYIRYTGGDVWQYLKDTYKLNEKDYYLGRDFFISPPQVEVDKYILYPCGTLDGASNMPVYYNPDTRTVRLSLGDTEKPKDSKYLGYAFGYDYPVGAIDTTNPTSIIRVTPDWLTQRGK